MNWQLYHWHLELSAKCTLKCPRCPRTEFPNTPWKNEDITYDDFTNSFTPEFICENVQRFTLCGDIGDPIYNKEFIDIIRYIKEVKPTCHIFVITNGSYKQADWWAEVAKILNEYDAVNFSVDGYNNDTNNLYRINSNFNSIMTGMHILGHQSKCFVNWAAIYFNFNQDNQDIIREIAKYHNCDAIQWTKSTKFGSKYGEAYDGETDSLEPRDEFISPTHRYERHVEYLTDRRIDNKEYLRTNEEYYNRLKEEYNTNILPLCLVGNRGMYLSADGTVHPCSWTSFPYKELGDGTKTIKYEDGFFPKHRNELSIKNKPLSEILDSTLWGKLTNTWQDKDRSWVECNLKCNVQYIDFDYAVGWETN